MKPALPLRSPFVLALLLCAQVVLAQAYPSKPVRVILGVTAGGLQDQLARGIVVDLAALWNQTASWWQAPGCRPKTCAN